MEAQSDKQMSERRDEVIRRMLATPPQPKTAKKNGRPVRQRWLRGRFWSGLQGSGRPLVRLLVRQPAANCSANCNCSPLCVGNTACLAVGVPKIELCQILRR